MLDSNKNSQKTYLTGYSQAGMEKKRNSECQEDERIKDDSKSITKMTKYSIQVRYWNFK